MDSFRLSYGPRRNFSLSKTLIGCGIIFVGLTGAFVAALFAQVMEIQVASRHLAYSHSGSGASRLYITRISAWKWAWIVWRVQVPHWRARRMWPNECLCRFVSFQVDLIHLC